MDELGAEFLREIESEVAEAVRFLCADGRVPPGGLIALGCSTSEIGGGRIGKAGSPELGYAVARGALSACEALGVALAAQCCEHLNRALVLPRHAAAARGYAPVAAIPHPAAGGSCASAVYRLLPDPVAVEWVAADAAIDIGETLIGMHVRPVAVPLRPASPWLGKARLTMAYARPKYIGGPRARYTID